LASIKKCEKLSKSLESNTRGSFNLWKKTGGQSG
jgi:hypothetical protein